MTNMNKNSAKKRLVVSFHNLPVELQEAVKQKYPNGYTDAMIRIDKGPGDFFYAVVFETEDVSYLVKIDVKVDGRIEEEEDKDYYNDDLKGADELIDDNDEGENDIADEDED